MKKGFTLIETMVAVTIFVIVTLIIAGVTLNIIESLRRALAMKSVIDNLSFAMESMTIELREADSYFISSGSSGDDILRFRNSVGDYIYFKRLSGSSKASIGRCQASAPQPTCSPFSPITSPSLIDVKSLNFELVDPVVNTDLSPDLGLFKRPYVRISIAAEAEAGPGKKTTFQLQTVASQRNVR